MLILFIVLIIISIVLFAASFSMTDRIEDLEDQLEEVTVSSSQETYQLKRKISQLEQQLKDDAANEAEIDTNNENSKTPVDIKNKPLLIQKIQHLHAQGYSIDDIENKTGIASTDVKNIISNYN